MSRRSRRRAAATLAAGALAVTLGAASPLTSNALLTDAKAVSGNTFSTRAACAAGATYPAAVLALNPTFYWRIGQQTPPAVTSVSDTSPNGLPGTVEGTGLTFGTANAGLIDCDTTWAVRFRGRAADTAFLVQRTAVPNPNTFTLSAWIRSNSTRGGWIVGMGGSRWGSSTNRDRVIYLQRNGLPTFSVGIGPRSVIAGTTPVNDNQPHLLVATLGPAGMALYVDGTQVASDPSVTTGATYTGNGPADPTPPANPATPNGYGYWRVGYDSTTGLGPVTPTRNQLASRMDEVAVWQNRQLTSAQVAGLYAGNHW